VKARIPLPDPEGLGGEERAIYDSILASRGNVEGPFLAWLHAPALAGPAEKLGAHCRYGSGLALRESELLIMLVAAHHRSNGEWRIHAPIAEQAGISAANLDAIRSGHAARFEEPRLQVLHNFAVELLRTNRVAPSGFEAARAEFGVAGLVEVVGVLGYYALVALTLNAFDMDAAEGEPPIFP
jgi:4-carboxymuconolactone decarboxylase